IRAAGVVRGSKLINVPLSHVTKLLLKRSVQLYLTTIVLVTLFTVLGWTFFMHSPGLKVGIAPPSSDLLTLIWKTITLQYFYGWADYLRLYAIFLLVSPFAMWLLRRGWWYILLIINIAVWLLFPAGPGVPDATQELLQPLSWQLIFFSGLSIGFYWNQITAWWRSQPLVRRKIIRWTVITLAIIMLVLNLIVTFGPTDFGLHSIPQAFSSYHLYVGYFDKERLPITRIALFFLWFWAAFFLFRRFEGVIKRFLGWLLLPFGTNSLYVYTLHALSLFFVHIWLVKGNIFFNFVLAASIIAIIRISIHYKFLMKIIPR
ncbi:MAG: OpgC domain-containing protein, partial [Candidatus Saccharibacteria bacterium]